MPQRPDLTRFMNAGAEFVALTRSQARDRARELVNQGVLAQSQVQTFVDELVEESRRRREDALGVLRKEIRRQIQALGIATKDDLAKVETRLRKEMAKQAPAKPKATKATKAPAKKAPAKSAKSTKAKAAKSTKQKAAS